MTTLLEVTDLHKRFELSDREGGLPGLLGRRRHRYLHAVDGVSFRIGRGEAIGLVGESGCGKSTLAQILARLMDASGGRVVFDGRDLDATEAMTFAGHPDRRRIQMVFQDATDSLNPRDTVFEAIADPIRRLMGGLPAREVRALVEETARRVNIPAELFHRFPHQLSGGQRARVGIARAIAVSPDLIILDEPTSALDVSIQAVILKLLHRLRAELGISYLFVSHDLNVVRMLCDRVLVMYLGKLVEMGPAAEIFRAPRHPYTAALIDAIPQVDPDHRGGRMRLEGEPRSPIDPDPHSCRLVGRCPRQQALCAREIPELAPEGAAHLSACHFPLDGKAQG